MRELTNTDLVALAGAGDADAWREIVRRHLSLLWSVARSLRLGEADAADVVQTTWLALAENLTRIREPAKLSAWLITTTRHEAIRTLKLRGWETPVDLTGSRADQPAPEDVVLAGDRATRLWLAYAGLTDRCRQLLRFVAYAPDLSYDQLARAMGMPVNSLGSTRSRCLTALRRRVGAEVAT